MNRPGTQTVKILEVFGNYRDPDGADLPDGAVAPISNAIIAAVNIMGCKAGVFPGDNIP
jgi:hypothetical protein